MSDPRSAWHAIRRRPRLAMFTASLGAVIVLGAIWAGLALQGVSLGPAAAIPASQTPDRPSPTPSPSPSPTPTATPTRAPTPSPTPGIEAVVGSDGRLTILVLGSDYRRGHGGNRTDTMMVISVDPSSGAVAAASIPRDTVNFPLPGGGKFGPKVNGLYQSYISKLGDARAGAEMVRAVGNALRVEIDNYVVIGFEGVKQMVDAVGGVDVVLAKPVIDPQYWLTATRRGVSFPAGVNHLTGERALIFARTRKADNDFERARRQQLLIASAVDAVRKAGIVQLAKLLRIADRFVLTDIPFTEAERIFRIVESANTGTATGIVFGPTKWAQSTGGSSFAPKLGEIRKWTARWMAPVAPAPASAPRSAPPGTAVSGPR